ncbi:hypothetical protein ACLKA7_000795 [Drosophila subpalustris]
MVVNDQKIILGVKPQVRPKSLLQAKNALVALLMVFERYCVVGIRIAANDPAEIFPLTVLHEGTNLSGWSVIGVSREVSRGHQSLPLARRMLWASLPKLPPGLQL